MAMVAGVDFGTASVRVSLVASDRGLVTSAEAEYPVNRSRSDPDRATQSYRQSQKKACEEVGI